MFKYNEKEIIIDVENYIESTYKLHYVNGKDIQVNDLIMAIGHGESSYISNAIEYLARYGKKDGNNVKDLYKAIHNIILLIHLNHTNDTLNIQKVIEQHKSYFGDKENK
jgi:hypothetical protein